MSDKTPWAGTPNHIVEIVRGMAQAMAESDVTEAFASFHDQAKLKVEVRMKR